MASRPLDRGAPLGLRQHASERTDLAKIDAVLVLAEQRVDEPRHRRVDQFRPLVQQF